MTENIIQQIEEKKVFAVVRCDEYQKAIDISHALIEGGIKLIEITVNFENSYKAIKEISKIDGVSVAAGSIITNNQATAAINAGAKLLVSPVLELSIIKLCKGHCIPLITGASTVNEAYNAWKLGVSMSKLFPARAMGGHKYVRDILKPMPFLKLMPTSGIRIDDFTDYLDAGAVAVGLGKALYGKAQDSSEITKNSKLVIEKLNEYLSR